MEGTTDTAEWEGVFHTMGEPYARQVRPRSISQEGATETLRPESVTNMFAGGNRDLAATCKGR